METRIITTLSQLCDYINDYVSTHDEYPVNDVNYAIEANGWIDLQTSTYDICADVSRGERLTTDDMQTFYVCDVEIGWDPADLVGCIAQCGADPFVIEDIEAAYWLAEGMSDVRPLAASDMSPEQWAQECAMLLLDGSETSVRGIYNFKHGGVPGSLVTPGVWID